MSKKKVELLDEDMEITLRGETHTMSLPTNGDLLALQRTKEGEDEDAMGAMYKFLEKLGLPKEFVDKMTPNQVVKVMESAADAKS
jgi:hypothetical protein